MKSESCLWLNSSSPGCWWVTAGMFAPRAPPLIHYIKWYSAELSTCCMLQGSVIFPAAPQKSLRHQIDVIVMAFLLIFDGVCFHIIWTTRPICRIWFGKWRKCDTVFVHSQILPSGSDWDSCEWSLWEEEGWIEGEGGGDGGRDGGYVTLRFRSASRELVCLWLILSGRGGDGEETEGGRDGGDRMEERRSLLSYLPSFSIFHPSWVM